MVGLIRADYFVMLTDQEGIFSEDPNKDPQAKLIQSIHLDDSDLDLSKQMNASAGIHGRGGMKPKLESCMEAISTGVKSCHIIDGRLPHAVLLEVLTDEGIGTMITSG